MIDLKLEASGYTAQIKDDLNFGEVQSIDDELIKSAHGDSSGNATFSGDVIIAHRDKKLLTCVKKLLNKEGEDLGVSLQTINALPYPDGQLLIKTCDEVLDNIKKK